MRQKDRRLSFFCHSQKAPKPECCQIPLKSATEKPSSRARPQAAQAKSRRNFAIGRVFKLFFFAPRRGVLFSVACQ